MQSTSVQVLSDGAFRDGDAMLRFQKCADLDGRPTWQFQSQLAGFLEQLGMATDDAEIGPRWWPESVETMLAIRTDPPIERHP
jgi:hypothetical protein